jgi:two-component system, OmpR family, response regulator
MTQESEPRVLFIDDDTHWCEVAQAALHDAGYSVITAPDASEALQKAEGVNLGLIILDLNLAGESGLNLMKYLRHNHPDVPILLFTGMEHDDTTVRAMLDQGADQYLRKGTTEELIVTVGAYFRQLG